MVGDRHQTPGEPPIVRTAVGTPPLRFSRRLENLRDLDAAQVLWNAAVAPPTERERGIRVNGCGRVWMSGAEIARRADKHRGTVSRVLTAAEEAGLVQRRAGSRGWSLAAALCPEPTNTGDESP